MMRSQSNSDRRVKYTAEGSKTSQTHQRVDVLNTDHKDVAVFRESSRIFTLCNNLFCIFLLTEIVFEFFFSSVIISARMVCKNRSRIARQIIASEATERRSASTSRFEERCVHHAKSGKQSDV